MASYIHHNGIIEEVQPNNRRAFSMKELQRYVDGYFELITIDDDNIMLVNEEGFVKQLPVNPLASMLVGYKILGDVLLCSPNQVF